jgi:hypothetical protein
MSHLVKTKAYSPSWQAIFWVKCLCFYCRAVGLLVADGFKACKYLAGLYVDRTHLNTVGAGVSNQLRRCIKPHRLGLEQGG